MTYFVRCGDCEAVLGQRLLGFARLRCILRRHRAETGCSGSGFVVRPVKGEVPA